MDSQNPSANDLGRLVRQNWPVSPQKNPRFKPEVWARIHSTPQTWYAWCRGRLPILAPVTALVVALAGLAGVHLARETTSLARDVESYIASIDPHRQLASSTDPR